MYIFPKKVDPEAVRLPACLQATTDMGILLKTAEKLTLAQPMTVYGPHSVLTMLEQKGNP